MSTKRKLSTTTITDEPAKRSKVEDEVKDHQATMHQTRTGRRQLANFYYFGLSFCHLQTEVTALYPSISFGKFKALSSTAKMTQVILDDMSLLTSAKTGRKQKFEADGNFCRLMQRDELVYVYEHSTYATCSSTLYSQLEHCFETDVKDCYMQPCCDSTHHLCLEPFFMNNESVLRVYESAQRGDLKEDIELLKGIVNKTVKSFGTKFHCPSEKVCTWNENDWTRRLSYGIQTLLPGSKVEFTAPLGLSWDSDILLLLGVGHIARRGFFLFRGAPDIVVQKKHLVMVGQQNEVSLESSSSEDDIIELANQRPPMHGECLPEKLGEVLAGLHLLLVSKVLRRMSKGKRIFDLKLNVQGILIDKIYGAYHCLLSVEMSFGKDAKLNSQVLDYAGGSLNSNQLCAHINSLVSKPAAN